MAMKDITDRQVVLAYIERDATWPRVFVYDILMRETGQPFKVCYKCMERACDRGYIDFGVSLRTGWVTDKGKALLK